MKHLGLADPERYQHVYFTPEQLSPMTGDQLDRRGSLHRNRGPGAESGSG